MTYIQLNGQCYNSVNNEIVLSSIDKLLFLDIDLATMYKLILAKPVYHIGLDLRLQWHNVIRHFSFGFKKLKNNLRDT